MSTQNKEYERKLAMQRELRKAGYRPVDTDTGIAWFLGALRVSDGEAAIQKAHEHMTASALIHENNRTMINPRDLLIALGFEKCEDGLYRRSFGTVGVICANAVESCVYTDEIPPGTTKFLLNNAYGGNVIACHASENFTDAIVAVTLYRRNMQIKEALRDL